MVACFEVSYEVCNKVGGIYTVLRSKSRYMKEYYKDNYYTIGCYNPNNVKDEFKELARLAFDVNPDEIQINTPLRPSKVEPLSREEISAIKAYFEEFGKKISSKAAVLSVYDKGRKRVEAISEEDTLKRRGKEC